MMEPLKESKHVMTPTRGLGKEMHDRLRAELQIPEKCRWFEVRFAYGEAISVKCEFMPEDGSD